MKIWLLNLFLFLTISAYCQKEDYIWLVGTANDPDSIFATSVIDFNSSPPKIDLKYEFIGFEWTNTNISDSAGNLVCYSNGIHLFNGQDKIIENGEEFQSSSSYPSGYIAVQGGLVIPYPQKAGYFIFILCDRISYIFDNGFSGSGCNPITYSIIDFGDDAGGGVIIEKKIPLTYDTLMFGQLTAVKHGNGRDWWVIGAPKDDSNRFHMFLANPLGILWDHAQKIGEIFNPGLGQAAISPNGEWLGLYNAWGIIPIYTYTEIDLYKFDRCSGMLSDHLQIIDTIGLPGGVAFSPNSRYMYTSHWDKIYQWDLEAADIEASRTLVAEYDGFLGDFGLPTRFYNMKLGPDGKIYISVPNNPSRYLHVIDQPDKKGPGCNVLQHHILLPTFNNFSLPHHPVTRLGPMAGSPCDTLVSAVVEAPVTETSEWTLYPNPASSSVTLSCVVPQNGQVVLLMYDALGREVRRKILPEGYKEMEVSLSGLPKGLYFYRVEKEGALVQAGKLAVE